MFRLRWVRKVEESCFQPVKAGHQEHERFMLYVIVQHESKKSVRVNTNATSAFRWTNVARVGQLASA